MKRSKLRIFAVWLMVLAVMFSSIQIDARVFAQGSAGSSDTTGKDISTLTTADGEKVLQLSGMYLWKGLEMTDANLYIKDGVVVTTQPPLELKPNQNTIMKYEFQIRSTKQINAGDYFEIALPNPTVFESGFEGKFDIINQTDKLSYGTYEHRKDTASNKAWIRITFNENAKKYQKLTDGFVQITSFIRNETGEIDFLDNYKVSVQANIQNHQGTKKLEGTNDANPYIKSGWRNGNTANLSWFIFVRQDQNVNLYKESGSIDSMQDLFIVDALQGSQEIIKDRLKVGTRIFIPQKDDPSGHTASTEALPTIDFVPDEVTLEAEDTDLDAIKSRLKAAFQKKPVYAVRERNVYIYLGNLNQEHSMTYAEALALNKGKAITDGNDALLKEFINHSHSNYSLTDEQKNRMLAVYGSSGRTQGKIVSWRVELRTKITDPARTDDIANQADIYWANENASTDTKQIKYVGTIAGISGENDIYLKLQKTWWGKNRDSVDVKIYKTVEGGTKAHHSTVTLEATEGFHKEIQLPRKESGKPITYEVEETAISGYRAEPTVVQETDQYKSFTLINNELTDIEIQKIWNNAAPAGITEIEAELLADARSLDPVKKVTLKENEGWKATVSDLPKYSGLNRKIQYTVKELNPPTGYINDQVTTEEDGKTVIRLTNRETVTLRVEKQWKNADGTAMDASAQNPVTFQIFAGASDTGKRITVGTDSGSGKVWTADSEALPKHDDTRAVIVYTLKEATPDGFTSEITNTSASSEPNLISFVAVNKKKPTEDTNTPPPNPPSGNTPDGNTPSDDTPSDTSERERTTSSAPKTSTPTSSETAENAVTTAATTEENAQPNAPKTTAEESEITTNLSDNPFVFTPQPTAATTSRTFEFVEIDEDIPLGMKTTAPIDLELLLIDEDIPLATAWYPFAQLPYTGFAANELFLGVGLFIITIGAVVIKRWL